MPRGRFFTWPQLMTMAFFQVVSSGVWAGPAIDQIMRTATITIGHREASEPFSFYDSDKQPVGYAIDLCLKIVDTLKQQLQLPKLAVKYVMLTPGDRMEAVESGKVDVECGSTINTPDRRKRVAFTHPHYIAGARSYGLMLRKDDPAFKQAVNGALDNLISNGEFEKLYEKWFLSPIPPSGVNLNIPMSKEMMDNLRLRSARPSM